MALSPILTVGETFLFRDAALWKLVERTLLPDLAQLTRPLWLWSAGCSTGEEAYTLAIVARRALPSSGFSVLGTDVNPKAVAAARVGVYSQWSLRGVEQANLDGLMISGTQTIRVHDDVKHAVRFDTHNLLDPEGYPPAGMSSFECIICRNVLIYMTSSARMQIIERFTSCLSPGGVLLLGHGEATGLPVHGLVPERHNAAVIYRKPLQPVAASHARSSSQKATPKRSSARHTPDARPSRPRAAHGRLASRTPDRRTEPQHASEDHIGRCRALLAQAAQQARCGQTDAAERNAALAMAANPLDPEPHVLLAALLASRDAFKQAESGLRRALFLDPASIPALWQLGTLYRMTNRNRQAAHAFARLLARLEGLPPDKEALPFDNLTVCELTTLLRAAFGEPTDA
jgi:chemotaxis protein methyltransferase CheR